MGRPTPRSSPRRGGPRGRRAAGRPAAGFAYLFTLLAVALLGLGLTVVADMDALVARREREAALLQAGHEFREALARYQAARLGGRTGQFPTRLEDLLRDPRAPGTLRHLRRLYADPVTGQSEWGLVREGAAIVGVHSLSSAQPLKQDGFEPNDARFRGAARYRDWVFTYPPDRPLPLPGAASAPLGAVPVGAGAGSAPQAGFAPEPVPAQR